MSLTFLPRKVAEFLGMAAIILTAYVLLRQAGLYAWTARESEGITLLIQLIGDIYAVLLAFMIFVIWTQFTEVENCVFREADSLNDLLRFSSFLNDEARSAIRRAATNYIRQVLGQEWTELGEGRKERQAEEAFAKLVAAVVGVSSKDGNQQFLRDHLFETLRTVSRCRDERVAKSLTRMPPTLSGLVKVIASILLLLLFLYPFHNTMAGAACIFVASLVLFLANFVMTDTDNPLKGAWNVRPDAFSELPR